jgi:hypothetical protein
VEALHYHNGITAFPPKSRLDEIYFTLWRPGSQADALPEMNCNAANTSMLVLVGALVPVNLSLRLLRGTACISPRAEASGPFGSSGEQSPGSSSGRQSKPRLNAWESQRGQTETALHLAALEITNPSGGVLWQSLYPREAL